MPNKKFKVIVSDRAKEMLKDHIRFMGQVNKEAAINKKNELIRAIRSLDDMPQRYPFLDDPFIPSNKYHKMFVKKWYIVLFQVADDKVYVDYIIDCRKDYSWLCKRV